MTDECKGKRRKRFYSLESIEKISANLRRNKTTDNILKHMQVRTHANTHIRIYINGMDSSGMKEVERNENR